MEHVCMIVMGLGHMCMAHVEVGEERHAVGSLLPPLRGLQGFNSDHQA